MTESTPSPTGRNREAPTRRHRRAMPSPRAGRESWARDHIAQIGTCAIGVISVALGFAYQNPALTRPIPRPGARQVSVVQYIDSIGPIWFVSFAGLGVICLVGLMFGARVLVVAHGAGIVLYGMFTCAVWLGWAFSDPRPAIVSPILALAVVVFNLLLVLAYSARER